MSTLEQLQAVIDKSQRIVFFGGAGVSTESGIPDFRSVDGLYNQKYDYPPEQILSHTFFEKHTNEFYRFYRDKMLCLDKQPNQAHLKLAELEQAGKLCTKPQAAAACMSCTAACCATTAAGAANSIRRNSSRTARACPPATAAV